MLYAIRFWRASFQQDVNTRSLGNMLVVCNANGYSFGGYVIISGGVTRDGGSGDGVGRTNGNLTGFSSQQRMMLAVVDWRENDRGRKWVRGKKINSNNNLKKKKLPSRLTGEFWPRKYDFCTRFAYCVRVHVDTNAAANTFVSDVLHAITGR
jgi:hypothetical protein